MGKAYLIRENSSQCSSLLLKEKEKDKIIQEIPPFATQLTRTKRSWIFRKADNYGIIPIIGCFFGGCRIIGALAIGVISAIGALITSACYCKSMKNRCFFFCKRAKDEMVRGAIELFPVVPYYIYLELLYAARTDDNIVLKFGAHGNFVHQTPGGRLIYTHSSCKCYQVSI